MDINNKNALIIDEIMAVPTPPVNISAQPDIKYIKLNKDVSKYMGISQKTWQSWKHSPDFDVVETVEGWPVEGLKQYKLVKKGKDNRRHGVMVSEGKARKLAVETRILEIKERKELGQLIPFDKHLEEMDELLNILILNMDYFISEVELAKNEMLLKVAEQTRDKVILRLKDVIQNAKKNKVVESSSSESSSESSSLSQSSTLMVEDNAVKGDKVPYVA